MSDNELVKLMKEYVDYDSIDWKGGRLSGTTFENTKSISELCAFIFPEFMLQNPLHADVHKGLRKIEAEILGQVLNLYNAPQTGCALLSGGGSERYAIFFYSASSAYKLFKLSQHENYFKKSAQLYKFSILRRST